ncbi:MAG: Crp/Fnr family transcriptional regulator [Acidobacteriota bacterium]
MRPTKLWYIERFNLFHGLQQQDKEELARMSLMEKKTKGTYIYLPSDPGDSVFLLKEGHVKICRLTEEGKEVMLTILSPGEVFGEVVVLNDQPRDHVAQALDNVLLCEFKKRDFQNFLRARPDLVFRISKLIGLRLQKMESRVVDLICKDVTTRVSELLLSLAEQQGKAADKHGNFMIKLTHQDIASLAGVSRQTATEILDRLKSEGLVELGHRSILIKNKPGLEAFPHSRSAGKLGA